VREFTIPAYNARACLAAAARRRSLVVRRLSLTGDAAVTATAVFGATEVAPSTCEDRALRDAADLRSHACGARRSASGNRRAGAGQVAAGVPIGTRRRRWGGDQPGWQRALSAR
jgi:hypothetical protein